MNNVYYKTISGDIYKKTNNPDIYIKVSPWNNDEDRRLSFSTIVEMVNNGQASKLNKNKAREELNTIWNNTDRYWEHDGKKYKTISNINLFEYRTMPPGHSWYHKWKDMQGEEHTITWTWYLVMFQGKLYWTLRTQYYPQQEIIHFKGFDIEPKSEHGYQWTNAKNLHPVYVKNENNKWEMI